MNSVISGTDWGFGGGDIWTQGMLIVGSVAGFLLLSIVVSFVPAIMDTIKQAVFYKQQTGERMSAMAFLEEAYYTRDHLRDRARRRNGQDR